MRITLDPVAAALLQRLKEGGHLAYAVGGCVRDSLLGRTVQDWDLCTSALPEEIQQCFSHLPCVLTGLRYGTVTVLVEGRAFEITTFREEVGYSDHRHPDQVRFLSSLEGDLSRRDFTINAMAADVCGTVIDCFGGREDLEKGQIRCVGAPEARFTEDALRMLRALRFAARFEFSIDPHTARGIHQCKEGLCLVAPERLRKELDGILLGKAPGKLLAEFSDLFCQIIPELRPCIGHDQYNPHHKLDVWQHTLAAVDAAEPCLPLRLALLLHDLGKASVFTLDKNLIGHFYGHSVVSAALCQRILNRLRYDHGTRDTVTTLVRFHDVPLQGSPKRLRRCLNQLGEENTKLLLRLRRGDCLGKQTLPPAQIEEEIARLEECLQEILAQEQCFCLKHLAVKGRDLLALGIPPGPELGQLLQTLLEKVLEGELENQKDRLLAFVEDMRGKN